MNPRYQIFISSTFRDLRKERQAVLDAILELGHFPTGMEVFPAADATPWEMIETIIDESDYYVLIIGGVYGSTDESGISYTEREYDFAVSRGIPILAFLHSDPAQIPLGMSEIDPKTRQRLSAFREKVECHHCKYWCSAEGLKSKVVISIVHGIRTNPRTGWIRGGLGDSAETLKKLTLLLEEKAQLKSELKSLRDSLAARISVGGELASGADTIEIGFESSKYAEWKAVVSWDTLLQSVGPLLLSEVSERIFHFLASEVIVKIAAKTRPPEENALQNVKGVLIKNDDFYKIIYQFMALEYIEPTTIVRQREVFGKPRTDYEQGYRVTKLGAQTIGRLNAIRKAG